MKHGSFVTLALFLASCSDFQNNEQIIAVVGKSKIHIRALDEALSNVSEFPGKDYSKPEHKIEIAKLLIEQELLYQEALKANIHERSYLVKKEMVREFLKEKVSRITYTPTSDEILEFYNLNLSHFQKLPANEQSLDFNKEKIRQHLIRKKHAQEIEQYTEALKSKTKLKFYPEHVTNTSQTEKK